MLDLTVPWLMVRKPFLTEHFLFCHTFLSLGGWEVWGSRQSEHHQSNNY